MAEIPTVHLYVSPALHSLGHGWGVLECKCVCGYKYIRVMPVQTVTQPCPRCGLGGGTVALPPDDMEEYHDGPWLTGVFETDSIHGRG